MSPRSFDAANMHAIDGAPFSNGTKYEEWSANWCVRCRHDDLDEGGAGCPLVMVALLGKTPAEWFEQSGHSLANRYHCAEFRPYSDNGDDPEPQPLPEPDGMAGLFDRPQRGVRMLRQPQPAEVTR